MKNILQGGVFHGGWLLDGLLVMAHHRLGLGRIYDFWIMFINMLI